MNSIPEKINIFYSVEQEVGDTEVIPAFPCDANNEKTNETARYKARWLAVSEARRTKTSPSQVEVYECENVPTPGARIIPIEENGKCKGWKVVMLGAFLLDLNRQTLLECLATDGVDPGGILRSELIFAATKNGTRLVRAESPDCRGMLRREKVDISGMKKVTSKDLMPGKRYYTKQGKETIFIAHVTSASAYVGWASPNGSIGHRRKRQLWFEPTPDAETPQEFIEKIGRITEEYKENPTSRRIVSGNQQLSGPIRRTVVDPGNDPIKEIPTVSQLRKAYTKLVKVNIEHWPGRKGSLREVLPAPERTQPLLMVEYGKEWKKPTLFGKFKEVGERK